MFKIKLYLYDSSQESNGYKGTDLSKYVLQGDNYKENITQELDTAEITLIGYPIQKEFDPETKMILERYETNAIGIDVLKETKNIIVSTDYSNKPILSDDNYYDHHISFIEASAVAQKRLVDNISATYKLKDVSLEEIIAYPDTDIQTTISSSKFTPSRNFGITTVSGFPTKTYNYWGKYFQLDGVFEILNRNGDVFNNIYNDISHFEVVEQGETVYKARFKVPKLKIFAGVENSNNFVEIGNASLQYKIEEFELTDEYNPTNTFTGTIISNDDLSLHNNSVYYPRNVVSGETTPISIQREWLIEDGIAARYDGDFLFKKYTNINAPTPTYITDEIIIKPSKQYKITISIYQFLDNIYGVNGSKYTGDVPNQSAMATISYAITGQGNTTFSHTSLISSQTSSNVKTIIYSANTKKIVLSSSTPYSALALLQKAIINSSIYEKENGVYIADVNNSSLPFYIDSNFIDELKSTRIIENFYNQKNLWEIMVECGNYIHAIPELVFGDDDRFKITFNRLGRTDEQTKNSNNISIMNFKSIEDYVSACSSYITNMVQLGGSIEEWVVPKTTSETYLVSNDTASLLVSKPIIELLEIVVKCNTSNYTSLGINNGDIANMIDYVYEENVYKTLSIDYKKSPNRGIALYYSLGKSEIVGGEYQLPQANTNIYSDYALKKVIYSAFLGYQAFDPAPVGGYWTNIQVQDFSFFVKYRTKDSVRQNHTRPDIRKYLLNSKYDNSPEHNQFNNQTDVVIDSNKFGNNMYGKLIRTGNSTYSVIEWNDSFDNLKHKGELYRINGELYYVATANHTYYVDHILSKVEFSKDYNQLSPVIGIPSEPRFYEISEQSLIWREFAINNLLLLTDDDNQLGNNGNYVFNYDHLSSLMFASGTDFAKYAITTFKGDKDVALYDQSVGIANFYKDVINPINAYSSENTLTYEWDMADNFSAGDQVVDTDKSNYKSLLGVQYTDIYGKSALMDFYIMGDITGLSQADIQELPDSPIRTKIGETGKPFIGDYDILATNVKAPDTNYNGRGIGLLKDCREAMSINYNLQLITNSDTFVTSPFVFLPQKNNVKIVLLSEEVNKLSAGYIDNSKIITPIDINGNTMNNSFDMAITKTSFTNQWGKVVVSKFSIDLSTILSQVSNNHFVDVDGYQRVKSIAVICDVSLDAGIDTSVSSIPYKTQFVVARNIPDFWDRTKALSSWYWGSPNKNEIFKNKQ